MLREKELLQSIARLASLRQCSTGAEEAGMARLEARAAGPKRSARKRNAPRFSGTRLSKGLELKVKFRVLFSKVKERRLAPLLDRVTRAPCPEERHPAGPVGRGLQFSTSDEKTTNRRS